MRRALTLLLGLTGCGRVGFDAAAAADAPRADAPLADAPLDVCAVTRVSTTPHAGDTRLAATTTPTGPVVLSVAAAGGPVRLQRFTPAWAPIDAEPVALGVVGTGVAAVQGTTLLVGVDQGGTATVVPVTFPGGAPTLGAATALPGPLATGGLLPYDAGLGAITLVGTGWFLTQLTLDGTLAGGGFGTGGGADPVDSVAVSSDGAFIATVVGKATEAACPYASSDAATGAGPATTFARNCVHPAVVQVAGQAVLAFESGAGIDLAGWSATTTLGPLTFVALAPTGRRPHVAADAGGVVIAWRDQATVVTARVDPVTLTPRAAPAGLPGIPAPLGITSVPSAAGTMGFVATADGMYRACL